MLLRIDSTREDPVYQQLAGSIRADIAAGRIGAGERLPSAKEVATSLGINLHTVLHAYRVLRDEGVIAMRPGRGATVSAQGSALADIHAEAAELVRRADQLGVARDVLASLVRELPAAPTRREATP